MGDGVAAIYQNSKIGLFAVPVRIVKNSLCSMHPFIHIARLFIGHIVCKSIFRLCIWSFSGVPCFTTARVG